MAVYKKDKSKWTKDGRCWGFRCYYTDMYGNRKQKESKLYHTKKEAIEAEILFLSKSETEDTIDNNVLFTVAYNDYLNYKKRTLKMTTYYSVEKRLNKYICSYFENYKLLSITSNTVNRFIDLLSTKKLDIKYQNSIIGYLKEFLVFCSDNYNFDRKIANKIIKHRIDTPKSVKRDVDWNFWTYDEFVTFINCVDDEFYNFMFWFLYYTGLRLGEMISLTWKDVDFEKGTIKIENNFTNKLGMGMYKIITPKTDNSYRVLDLDTVTLSKLKAHYELEKKIYGFNNDMFLFGTVRPVSPTSFARYLNSYIEKSGVKRITPHGFRHSHASLLIHLGCDSRDVAERIGDTVQTVEKTYYHMFPRKKTQTVCALNKLNN